MSGSPSVLQLLFCGQLFARHCPAGECPLAVDSERVALKHGTIIPAQRLLLPSQVGYSVQCDREVIKDKMPRYRRYHHSFC